MQKLRAKIFDNHSHIGPVPGFAYYGLPEAVKPTTDYDTTSDYVKGMDGHGVDRALVMSNYGYPDSGQPFTLNPLVAESAEKNDRLLGAIWVSALPKDREKTEEALKLIGEKGLIALKTTCLLGGTFDPGKWEEDGSAEIWKMILDAGAEADMPLHIHTSPGGGSDIDARRVDHSPTP